MARQMCSGIVISPEAFNARCEVVVRQDVARYRQLHAEYETCMAKGGLDNEARAIAIRGLMASLLGKYH